LVKWIDDSEISLTKESKLDNLYLDVVVDLLIEEKSSESVEQTTLKNEEIPLIQGELK
jgi:hypothetical protein